MPGKRAVGCMLVLLGLLCSAYFGWSILVLDHIAAIPGAGPESRGFPYPDQMLDAMLRWHVGPPPIGTYPSLYPPMRRELLVLTIAGVVVAFGGVSLLWWDLRAKKPSDP
jgi:hypothetical protein